MTTRRPDIAEALHKVRVAAEEGAPQGAPQPSDGPQTPAGGPKAPVTHKPHKPAKPTATTGADQAETDHERQHHERQLEHDLEELAARAEKADEYLELAQRTKADFENYRRRASREQAVAQERGIKRVAGRR